MLNIQKKRTNYKPFEYPEVQEFIDVINKTFWVHSEVDFAKDIQDFKTQLSESEKEVFKRSLLSIAQIEVNVKQFWGNLYRFFPKPEFNGLGSTFAENEYRHSEAYSRLLDVLGYYNEFNNLLEIPIFKERIELSERELSTDDIFKKLLYFTLVIENSSLFSQFANILSFSRFKGLMKNTSNIIAWTSVDEDIHARSGMFLIKTMIKEGYEVDKEELSSIIRYYIQFEERLLDWIYELGELPFYSKKDILNFIKYRIDLSITEIGMNKVFNITEEQYKPMEWFEQEIYAGELDDFFAKRPVAYTKHNESVTSDDLF